MNQTYILQNQDKHFFGKSKEWLDGYDANSLFKTPFKDEAINQMVEISSKDYKQRVRVVACELNDKGLPIIDAEIMAAPLPKAPKLSKIEDDLFSNLTDESAELSGERELVNLDMAAEDTWVSNDTDSRTTDNGLPADLS